MTSIHFAHPGSLLLLAALPILFLLIRRGVGLRRVALRRFGVDTTAARLGLWGRAICLAAMLCLVLGLAEPFSAGTAKEMGDGGEIVFLLDVSRSMLSDDVRPSRLERAKQAIAEFVNQRPGERVALIAFAGTQSVECPLTNDIAFFQEMLKRSGPGSVSRGGTRIGDAMQFTLRSAFDDLVEDRKRLVLVTDGGEQDRDPWAMTDELERRKVQLLIAGVGSELQDSVVPVSISDRTPLLYHGETVRTHLESAELRKMAQTAGGEYRDISENPLGLRPNAAAPANLERARLSAIVLAAIAFALLLTESVASKLVRTRGIAIGLVAALLFDMPVRLSAQNETVADWARQGEEAFDNAKYGSAIEFYKIAVKQSNGRLDLIYNLACALYSDRDFEEAFKEFSHAQMNAAKGSDLDWKCRKGRADSLYQMSANADPSAGEFMLVTALNEYQDLAKLRTDDDAAFDAQVVERRLAAIRKRSRTRPHESRETKSIDPGAMNGTTQGLGGLPTTGQRVAVDQDW
ncbi:MAG TPA: VWA domain-containing protein [Bryobacteraceae bacterium]